MEQDALAGLPGQRTRRFGDQRPARALLVLARAVEERHPELAEHGLRVADSCERTGRAFGLGQEARQTLQLAARLHDVGKMAVPKEILDKPGRLTAAEWEHVCRHPEIGADLLTSSNLEPIARIVVAHHERPDGSGYPYGLAGEHIPLEALIIGCADAFDAMVSARPYRAPLSVADAVRELERGAGSQFDAAVVGAFLESALATQPV